MTLREYDSVPIKNVAADDLMLESEQELETISHINDECSKLFSFIAKCLGDKVVEVTASARLNEIPACISAKGPISLGMEKYFSAAASDSGAPRAQHVFELNPHHRIFKTMTTAYENGDESHDTPPSSMAKHFSPKAFLLTTWFPTAKPSTT